MSGRVFSRPRTKVYDTNYNIGESLYKPALDQLDRKYGGRGYEPPTLGLGSSLFNGDTYAARPPPPPPADIPTPRSALRELEDEFFGEGPRRRPNSALLNEYDAIFEGRGATRPGTRNLEEEIEDDLSASMKRLRAKATRSMTEDMEEIESGFGRKEGRRPRLDFGEKVMESVGLTGRARQALEEEGSAVGRRRFLKMTTESGEGDEGFTKWTALKPTTPTTPSRRSMFDEEEPNALQSAAAARARMSRARLDDLESEMQAISEKSLAREKRVRDLKALVQENEASALDNLQTTVRVKSSIQSEKRSVAY